MSIGPNYENFNIKQEDVESDFSGAELINKAIIKASLLQQIFKG